MNQDIIWQIFKQILAEQSNTYSGHGLYWKCLSSLSHNIKIPPTQWVECPPSVLGHLAWQSLRFLLYKINVIMPN